MSSVDILKIYVALYLVMMLRDKISYKDGDKKSKFYCQRNSEQIRVLRNRVGSVDWVHKVQDTV
jgi:hypothetical protein